MEESPVDRAARRRSLWGAALFVGYCALVVYLITNEWTRILGIANVPIAAWILARYVAKAALDDAPQWARRLMYRGWHGKYRAFEDHRVRVIDGERDTASLVFAQDIFEILDERPSAHELAKLQARYGSGLVKGGDGEARGEWLFTDVACLRYVHARMDQQRSARGQTAHRLAQWLERSVFMPIDNRRSAQTGKTYPFTKEAARR